VLEDGAFVLHGATLSVQIGRTASCQWSSHYYPVARDAAPEKLEFQHEVLEVNKEFAEHYSESYQQGGFEAVSGVVPPKTSWNPNPVKPTIGKNVLVEESSHCWGRKARQQQQWDGAVRFAPMKAHQSLLAKS